MASFSHDVPVVSHYKNSENNSGRQLFVKILLKSLLPYAVIVALNVIVMLGSVKPSSVSTTKGIILGLFGAAFVLSFISYIISSLCRRAKFRIIPLCNIQSTS